MSTTAAAHPRSSADARPGAAERLSRMIQLPTVSAELEHRTAEPFERFLELVAELYPRISAQLVQERVTDFGLLLRWQSVPGSDAVDPVLLMAHYDVVPVDEDDDWTHPPFEGVIADGFVHGRGALDDKGPLLVLLEAVENLLAAGHRPARDICIWLGGNEETFGDAAASAARLLRERGITPWLVIDEGGAVTDAPLPFVAGRAAVVGVGEKGVLTARLHARAVAGHSSAPEPLTAVSRVARAVARLRPHTFRPRTPRALSTLLAAFAPRAHGVGRLALRVLARFPALTAAVFAKLGGEPAAMVRTTVAATMQSGGTAANVLPSHAEAVLNLRIALGETADSVVRRIRRRIADADVRVTILEAHDPSPESDTDNEQFDLIRRAVAVSHPDAVTVPYVMMAATDARHFHRFCPAVYRFAPLLMDAELRASIHGVNERVAVSELARGELFHRTLITSLS